MVLQWKFILIGPDSSFILLKNGLPKVTILSETTKNGSTTHAGNKITITSGTTIFKPTIFCNITYACPEYISRLVISRSNTQNGTYTQLAKYTPGKGGANGTYNSLNSSYYYELEGANSTVYLKDTVGSAVQFVQ